MECKCSVGGKVLLFYNFIPLFNVEHIAQQLKELSATLKISGKIKLSTQGYNVTMAGSLLAVKEFMNYFMQNYIPNLQSLTVEQIEKFRHDFFKPTNGCVHAFDGVRIKIVNELCQFDGVATNQRQITSDRIIASIRGVSCNQLFTLAPNLFHEEATKANVMLLDLRNYYESQIGFFEGAVTPPIRKFSGLKNWIEFQPKPEATKILTYCTGGVRCEQAESYLRKKFDNVFMLEGGIHNYMEWVKANPKKSIFKGANYVFDGRQSEPGNQTVSFCTVCNEPCEHMIKCYGTDCHLLIIQCKNHSVIRYCCEMCRTMIVEPRNETKLKPGQTRIKRQICFCEKKRRDLLLLPMM